MATKSALTLSMDPTFEALFMDVETLAAVAAVPERLSAGSAWIGHIPFARWLVRTTEPRTFVELGVHWGDSYFAVCEAVRSASLPTRAFGVDTWLGDSHAGHYSEDVYLNVSAHQDRRYGGFSTLIRSTFSDASKSFEAESIDLLHIDGCHTYDAVREDFETWRPKLSRQGVVLFHDTQVTQGDFGVYKYWAEIERNYPSFEFHHSSGLGVLCVGEDIPAALLWLTRVNSQDANRVRTLFSTLGGCLNEIWRRENEIWRLEMMIQDLDEKLSQLDAQVIAMEQSLSWYVTRPLRRIARQGFPNRIAHAVRSRLHR